MDFITALNELNNGRMIKVTDQRGEHNFRFRVKHGHLEASFDGMEWRPAKTAEAKIDAMYYLMFYNPSFCEDEDDCGFNLNFYQAMQAVNDGYEVSNKKFPRTIYFKGDEGLYSRSISDPKGFARNKSVTLTPMEIASTWRSYPKTKGIRSQKYQRCKCENEEAQRWGSGGMSSLT